MDDPKLPKKCPRCKTKKIIWFKKENKYFCSWCRYLLGGRRLGKPNYRYTCPNCGGHVFYSWAPRVNKIRQKKIYSCKHCKKSFQLEEVKNLRREYLEAESSILYERNEDCVFYEDCLRAAAIKDVKNIGCKQCEKYQTDPDWVRRVA